MADKRITELTNEKLILGDGDYTIVDSNEGTYKYKLKRIVDSIPAIDDSLSHEGEAADAKATGDEIADVKRDLSDKANTDGTYDGMTVGNAKQLLSEKYQLDEEPYLFRASGGDGSDRVEECIVGGSVVWNQLVQNGNFETKTLWDAVSGTWDVSGNIATFTKSSSSNAPQFYQYIPVIASHRYLIFATVKASVDCKWDLRFGPTYYQQDATANTWITRSHIRPTNASGNIEINIYSNLSTEGETLQIKNICCFDLTALFGSTIADYIYSLEQATAGAGVAWFKKYFPDDYYPYSAPTLRHVEGVSAKQIRDSDDNVTAIYPLDSSLTLRGIPKLTDGKMCFDGDKYNADGTVTRNTILRAYQSGDESLSNAITDGANTVVYSANASTETATPYTALQTLDPNGTEEFLTTGIVPVGHYSKYLENLRSKIEGLPKDFSTLIAPTEKAYKATRNYTVGSLLIVDNILYKVTSAIANGGTITPNTNVTATTLAAVIAAL